MGSAGWNGYCNRLVPGSELRVSSRHAEIGSLRPGRGRASRRTGNLWPYRWQNRERPYQRGTHRHDQRDGLDRPSHNEKDVRGSTEIAAFWPEFSERYSLCRHHISVDRRNGAGRNRDFPDRVDLYAIQFVALFLSDRARLDRITNSGAET